MGAFARRPVVRCPMCVPTVPWDVSACTSVCVCTVDMSGPGRGRAVRRCYAGMGTGPVSAERCRADRCSSMVVRKWDGAAPSYVGRRVGRSSAVTEIVTNLKQDRPKQNRWMERQRRYLSFPYSTPPRIAKLGPGERSARVGRTSCRVGHGLSLEPTHPRDVPRESLVYVAHN